NVAINLAPNESAQGLPPFIQSLFNTEIDIIQNNESSSNLALCEGETYTLFADVPPTSSIIWYRDGVELSEDSMELEIDSEGHYEVYIEPNNGDCPIEGEAYVSISPIPESYPATLIQCDIDGTDDGITLFDLEEIIGEITGFNQSLQVSFYSDVQSAEESRLNALPFDYRNNSSPQIIYAKVQDPSTGCYSISELTLESQFLEPEVVTLTECDTDGIDDGFFTFNLNSANTLVAANEDSNIDITYFRNSEDALLEINQLPSTYINETQGNQQIFARLENENSCSGIVKLNLAVNPIPDIKTEEELLYCLNYFPETITLDAGLGNKSETNYTYLWSTGETTPKIEVNEPKVYTVEVFNTFGCSETRTIRVLPSNIATITNIEVENASNNNTISVLVSGEGDYEYSLDDTEVFQDENLFDQVRPGLHTVYIRDKNECGIIEQRVSVIGFPKFFTPNGDGSNDTWQVKGISPDFQSQTTVFIYDRYGKLLKELAPLSRGWDGKFNGLMLPTSDYWFRVRLEDGREFTGHFTLKR
ncbi:MAG: T9SS type B sorting domain-containing protein, partial [Flavobacteriaceae bacterium]|nr:T9SS type B sorting domain-containing protein [Flavobacteriaceae bacterium]